MPPTELPRLTGSLRAFSGLSSSHSQQPEIDDLLKRKRQLRSKKQLERNLSWSELKSLILDATSFDKNATQEVKKLFKELLLTSKEIVGQESSANVLEGGTVFIFKTLKHTELIGNDETKKLKDFFGAFPASAATKACHIVKNLVSLISEDSLALIEKRIEGKQAEQTKEFGSDIKFMPFQPRVFSFDDDLLSDSEDEEVEHKISFVPTREEVVSVKETVQTATMNGNEDISSSWLREQCELYFADSSSGLSVLDLCSALFDILASDRDNAALQNELFELLGFDRFEFIQTLLADRHRIVLATSQSASDLTESKEVNRSRPPAMQNRPSYGCQVMVQSEKEKQLMRLVRKEERKGERRQARRERKQGSDDRDVDQETYLKSVGFDPEFMKTQRELSLQAASSAPLFSRPKRSLQSSPVYPHVFDALAEMQRATAFISDTKVVIPPNTPVAPSERETPIPISSLDEVGQMGFQGMKHLNRIQSIVFDAAYNTNENLLICAPTGAGKTNIAMLTILREIKQNIEEGIIYVAPMKALAAEMVQNFGKRLASLGISVRELTGDMQLSKAEILKTQMLVTTPEKWDVVTRKSTGDVALAQLVKLLIIDEVHLLHDDRGSVIECLVARTLRQVESSQSMIRIVGLSATLPNYIDVAHFLRVNPYEGLFFFDGRFRPVPLKQTFIGVKGSGHVRQMHDMDTVCYEKVLDNVQQGHQVMKSKNKQLRELFSDGFGIHHAGMLRQDRNIVEKLFAKGFIRVLVCTATLAWGVNLPAHAVVIKGTQMYDAKKGSFVDIGILDVLQIFGRAGRPQFDTQGEGIIITSHDKLSHYLALLTRQSPIESQFVSSLTDSLNAEISLGTVANVDEAVEWLSYTYLYIRMRVNPLVYGIPYGTKEERTGYLSATDLGRTASHFYIKYDTIEVFNEMFKELMPEPEVLAMLSHSQEFEQVKVREDEIPELEIHMVDDCYFLVKGGVENTYGKVNILLQTFISRGYNSARLMRGLFEIALHRGWPTMAYRLLALCKMLDKRLWGTQNPLRQFTILNQETLTKLEDKRATIFRLRDMTADEIGHMIKHPRMGATVKRCVEQFPAISLASSIQPITRTVLRVRLTIKPDFQWEDRVHGSTSEPWWIWVEDPDNNHIYHSEYFLLHKKQYYVRGVSDRWLGAEVVCALSFKHLILPERHPPHTELLDLQPLPAVYIAPLKALVRERMDDWKVRFEQKLGRSVVELTGDVTPDMRAIAKADVIVTTPEKWDGISRSWQTRNYVKAVALLVIDEIHLLGEERGPVLEVIVSRTNFISSHTEKSVRVIGLSTALANASDLADWLGIQQAGMFNFRPSVRPVPLEVHISGYPGKHYCPRMATMNKPTFAAIRTHSPTKPVLVFVSSRRQTRLTALELISFLAAEDNPKQWLHMPETEIDSLIKTVKDNNLKLTLSFGIALHHAGLHERDRKVAEELFVNQKIQILIATSTLAWGVNFPAHLVVVKGTEYYDGKTRRYVDFPITDVLQMMGRAGRPQYDDHGVAVILVHDIKKHFYKKFLYEPFPVESSLLEVLPDHLNAEIVAGTITSKQDAMDYLTWTYFFRRLLMNPSYYELEDTENESVNKFLSGLDGMSVTATTLGRISSYYYLSHLTLRMFNERLHADCSLPDLIQILARNILSSQELAPSLPLEVDPHSYDSPHTKAHLLFQAHFSRLPLPSTDYLTDTNSAMIDVSSSEGWLATSLRCMHLVQMVVQGRWLHDCTLLTLPCVDSGILSLFRLKNRSLECLPELLDAVRGNRKVLNTMLGDALSEGEITELFNTLARLPQISVKMKVRGVWAENELGQKETKAISTAQTEGLVRNWVQVHADQEYVIVIEIAKDSLGFKGQRRDTKAHAPHFPKVKDAGWWIVLGEIDSGELLAVKRVGQLRSTSTVSVSFYTSEALGRKIYTVYLMNDAYLGMDQQYDVHLEIIDSDISSQVNSEVHF
ncbi:Activating signal cointegrator 1 complex subunit 3 [Acropora cervicornis]|uniref:Activating signal cointegrator 1 complex subunit 3 n=1 Tax=Acropora cervicornis TaxID=6130 RepID=A0AAD9R0N2_ACRCE|nr:Activating signal cointegrator 1 complex subunit 3 [Acropora cervicornis]